MDEFNTSSELLAHKEHKNCNKRTKKETTNKALQEAINNGLLSDPKFEFYLEAEVPEQVRNNVWSAVMYYVDRPPKAATPPYDDVAGSLNPGYTIAFHGIPDAPVSTRFASGKQISHLLWFLSQHHINLFPGDPPAVRMHVRIEGGDYFPVFL